MSLNYDSDDAFPRSPGLAAVRPRATPSPTPPPMVTHRAISPVLKSVSHPSSRRRGRPNRRKIRPIQGDVVLVRNMDPNRPDIAREVGERALNPDTASEEEEDDDEDDDEVLDDSASAADDSVDRAASTPSSAVRPPLGSPVAPTSSLSKVAQQALHADSTSDPVRFFAPIKPPPPIFHRDSVVDPDQDARRALSTATTLSGASSGDTARNAAPNARSPPTQSPPPLYESGRQGSVPNVQSSTISPHLRELTIPPSHGSPVREPPAVRMPQCPRVDASATSPRQPQQQQLPSFRHLSDFAEAAQQQEASRAQTLSHRQSISSMGQSPTSMGRQHSVTSMSPATPFPPLSAASPAGSDIGTRDPFLRSGQHLTLFSNVRRQSQASEQGPYSATLHSASTNDSYQSSDSLSPGSQSATPLEMRASGMSIDGALSSRTLPPPVGTNMAHIPPHGSASFKCTYSGCTAAPFQTQYLLNSHANVHSQTRSHFCPVAGCARAEGGKGFKRKNEMIRHGLVHASPGYVCPFCPDREHRYPRPDNLQRHVRVHHVDKDKDDPELRDVLAQRLEGGSRGRRRRVS